MHWKAWRVCVTVGALFWPFQTDRLPAVNPAAVHAAWAPALLSPMRFGITLLGFAQLVTVALATLFLAGGTALLEFTVTVFWMTPGVPASTL